MSYIHTWIDTFTILYLHAEKSPWDFLFGKFPMDEPGLGAPLSSYLEVALYKFHR